jgi:hypothetical protein
MRDSNILRLPDRMEAFLVTPQLDITAVNLDLLNLLCQIIRPPLVAYKLSLWWLFFIDISLSFAGGPLRG